MFPFNIYVHFISFIAIMLFFLNSSMLSGIFFAFSKSNNNNKKFLLRSTEKIDTRRIIARYTSSLLPSFFSLLTVLSVITNLYAFNSLLVFTDFFFQLCFIVPFALHLHIRLTHNENKTKQKNYFLLRLAAYLLI